MHRTGFPFGQIARWHGLESLRSVRFAGRLANLLANLLASLVAALALATPAASAAPRATAIPHSPRGVILEDFESGSVVLESADPAQDMDPNAWNVTSAQAYGGSQYSLRLYGNTWKAEPIAPYAVTAGTVLQCAALVTSIGEMQAFGVSDSVNTLYYTFEGTQLPTSDPWFVVYQGAFPEGEWNLYLLPIGRDWFDRYGYLPEITRLIYVNDRDTGNAGIIYFDAIADVTEDLPQPPSVEIVRGRQSVAKVAPALYRVSIQFGSQVYDPDTPPEQITYFWDFGDGGTSAEPSPLHEFLVEADYTYSVILFVRDPDGLWGRDSTQVRVEPGAPAAPLTMNFVGDVMLARGYDYPGGIIDQHGPEWPFIPTRPYVGDAADINTCNLECPFTDEGVEHPTKSVTFRARPENIAGIAYAGFDVVSLGNNHIIDYGQRGMEETLEMLASVDIPNMGAGDDDYLAIQPAFLNAEGISIAFLGQCNRTGREYNYQPFLDAGYNKPGFAWEIEPNLDRAFASTTALADLTVIQLHSGIEYSTGPGTIAGSGWPLEGTEAQVRGGGTYSPAPHPIDPADPRFHPRGEPDAGGMGPSWLSGTEEDGPLPADAASGHAHGPGAARGPGAAGDPARPEDFFFPTRPSLTDRQLRWHAVEQGADLVICHHPHVLQGFEIYNGVLIAHSLGNFVFDQGYAETFPSLILYSELDKYAFRSFTFRPAFVDDWVPQVVSGRLGREILDRQADYSRELGTVVTVDPAELRGTIQLHPEDVVWTPEAWQRTEPLEQKGGYWMTAPVERGGAGTLSRVLPAAASGAIEVRLGREMVWHGDFEDEGATFWDLNSSYETYDSTIAHQGERSLRLRRSSGTNGVVTNLQGFPALLGGRDFSLGVWMKTQNANQASFEASFYSGRGTGNLGTFEVTTPVDGTHDWTRFWRDLTVGETPWFFIVRASIDPPSSGEETAWFDEARLVAWDDWQPLSGPIDVPYPSNYRYLQFRVDQAQASLDVAWEDVQGVEVPSAIFDPPDAPAGGALAAELILAPPRPNPFRSVAAIEYRLARSGRVRVEVFDVAGRKLRTLVDAERTAGVHRETWAAGDAPDGIYLLRCEAGGVVRTQKLLRLR